jgi:hypothetical protein
VAPLPSVPNVAKFELEWVLEADAPKTRFLFLYSGGPPDAADMTTLATAVRAAAVTNLVPYLWDSYTLGEVVGTDLSSDEGATGAEPGSTTGGRAGSGLPANVCTLVNHTIERRYRGGKPRSYLPFSVDGDLANNRDWSAGYVAALQAGFDAFIADLIGASSGTTILAGHVSVSYYNGFNTVGPYPDGKFKYPAKLRAAPIVDAITASTVATRISSQRRRLGKS